MQKYAACSVRSLASVAGHEVPLTSVTTSSETISKSDPNSLHANIHYLLKKVPIGRMNKMNLQDARASLFIVSKWGNEQGAKLSEALLERLYAEQPSIETVETEMYNACMNAWNNSGVDGKTIVYKVESIFERMKQRCGDYSMASRPDRTSYNSLLNSYSTCDEDSSFKVHALLDEMKSLSKSDEEIDYALEIQPDEITYNSIMNYYATRTNQHYAAQQAEDILLQMSELSQQPDSNVRITSTSFNIAIKAWSNAGLGLDGAEHAKILLQMMTKWHNQGFPNVEPTADSFSTVIDAYAKVSEEDALRAVESAMDLLDRMEASSISDSRHINSCYNAAANVVIKMRVPDAGRVVRELMSRMTNMDAVPDEQMYIRCIEACVGQGGEEGIHEAQVLLNEMTESLGNNPSSFAFNVLLDAKVKQHSAKSMELADELLTRMQSLGGESRPDVASYSIIIGACRSGSEAKAVGYLRSMLRSYTSDHYSKAKPNSFVFNHVINLLSRSNEEWADDVIYKTFMAMLNQQKQGNTSVCPDTITYNTVISKLTKKRTKDSAKKVMRLLEEMESNEETGIVATPDIITYTNVLKMQGHIDPNRAASIASSYLQKVLTKRKLPPIDQVGLRTLFLALSKRGKSEDANLLLRVWERMESCTDTVRILDSDMCNLILMTFKKVKADPPTAGVVLTFLRERFRRLQDGDKSTIIPTVVGMNEALSILASCGRVNDVISILEIMKGLDKKGDINLQLSLDAGCYQSILASLPKVPTKSSAIHAKTILIKAKADLDDVPISVVNAAINACAWTTGDQNDKMKSMQIAFDIFRDAKETQSYDDVTFGSIIKVCMKLSSNDDARFKLVEVSNYCYALFSLIRIDGLILRIFVVLSLSSRYFCFARNKAWLGVWC
jgi:hypothetical protein